MAGNGYYKNPGVTEGRTMFTTAQVSELLKALETHDLVVSMLKRRMRPGISVLLT
jgi:hypothetical protein